MSDERFTVFSVNDGADIVAYFFDKDVARAYVKQAKKDCRCNDLSIVEKVVDIKLVRRRLK